MPGLALQSFWFGTLGTLGTIVLDGTLLVFPLDPPSAFALDLFECGGYTLPQGAAGALSFHDPLEGTETSSTRICYNT